MKRKNVTIARIRNIDDDTVEIVKRVDQNKTLLFKMGITQPGLYERVTVNRKNKTVAIDRIDVNWWAEEPFLGRRDLFMTNPEKP